MGQLKDGNMSSLLMASNEGLVKRRMEKGRKEKCGKGRKREAEKTKGSRRMSRRLGSGSAASSQVLVQA